MSNGRESGGRADVKHGLCSHVRYALRRIRRSYADGITLTEVARERGRQTEYLGWLFRHETGTSFRQRLAAVRVRQGARLIRSGAKIDAVALLTGYRSKKNFYEQFRRQFGLTPGEYRARHRRRARADGARHADHAPSASPSSSLVI
jgi:AraC-like DNA-binding protein